MGIPRRITRTGILLTAAIVAGGCSNYPISPRLQNDIVQPSGEAPVRFAGDIDGALAAANDQRMLYWNEVSTRANTRQFVGTSLLALSAAAVYKGIRSDSESTKRWLAQAGAIGGAVYMGNEYLTNDKAESAYLKGFREITCLILWTRPLLIPQEEHAKWRQELDDFERMILTTDRKVSELQEEQALARDRANGNAIKSGVPRELRAAVDALRSARRLLDRSRALDAKLATNGSILRRRVEAVVADIGNTVHASEKNVQPLTMSITTASAINRTFRDIKPEEPPGQDASAADSTSDADDKTVQSEVGNAAATAGAQDTECAQKDDAKDAKPSDPAAKNGQTKAETDIKSLQGKVKTLEKMVSNLKSGKQAAASAPPSNPMLEDKIVNLRRDIKQRISELYAKQRRVNRLLVGIKEIKDSLKAVDPCQKDDGTQLTLSPDTDELAVTAGNTYQFGIAGGKGIPRVSLLGQTGDDDKKGLKLTTVIEGGKVLAKIAVGACAPPGVAHLEVTDADGRQKEEVKLTISAATKAK